MREARAKRGKALLKIYKNRGAGLLAFYWLYLAQHTTSSAYIFYTQNSIYSRSCVYVRGTSHSIPQSIGFFFSFSFSSSHTTSFLTTLNLLLTLTSSLFLRPQIINFQTHSTHHLHGDGKIKGNENKFMVFLRMFVGENRTQ